MIIIFLCYFAVAGPVEYDPEYQLIVQANNLTVEIDNEISRLKNYYLYLPEKNTSFSLTDRVSNFPSNEY